MVDLISPQVGSLLDQYVVTAVDLAVGIDRQPLAFQPRSSTRFLAGNTDDLVLAVGQRLGLLDQRSKLRGVVRIGQDRQLEAPQTGHHPLGLLDHLRVGLGNDHLDPVRPHRPHRQFLVATGIGSLVDRGGHLGHHVRREFLALLSPQILVDLQQ